MRCLISSSISVVDIGKSSAACVLQRNSMSSRPLRPKRTQSSPTSSRLPTGLSNVQKVVICANELGLRYERVEALPRNENGKVLKRALLEG